MREHTFHKEYGIPELQQDFPELAKVHKLSLIPVFAALWQRLFYLLNLDHAKLCITHIRDVSDPRFADRTYELVCKGRIIDISVSKSEIDEKDHCQMACKIALCCDQQDEQIIRELMEYLSEFTRSYTVQGLTSGGLELIKYALQEDKKLTVGSIYSCIRSFIGDYELRQFEQELCKRRREVSHT